MKMLMSFTLLTLSLTAFAHGDLEAHFKPDSRFTFLRVTVSASTGNLMFYEPRWKGALIGEFDQRHESEVAGAIESVGECLCEVIGKKSAFPAPYLDVSHDSQNEAIEVYALRRQGAGTECGENKKTLKPLQNSRAKAYVIPTLICTGGDQH